MDTVRQSWGVIIGVIIALAIGLVLGYWWGYTAGAGAEVVMAPQSSATASTSPKESGESAAGVSNAKNPEATAEGDSVEVAGQPAGDSVAVQSVTFSERGWIAIRDSSGRTLGAALFPAGTHTDVSVPLLRATEPGQRYQVLLYFDDGNKSFDLGKEILVVNPDGSVAGTMFSTNTNN